MAGMIRERDLQMMSADMPAPSSSTVKKKEEKSYWFDVPLFPSTDDKYPEISFKELVAEKKAKEAKDKLGAGQSILNPFVSDDEDDLRAMAERFEAKYGDDVKTKSKKRNRNLDDYIDRGAGYDENDSFIDNSEYYDEIVPPDLETDRGGFYVNHGDLLHVPVSEDEEDSKTQDKVKNDAALLQRKRKKKMDNANIMAKSSAKTGAKNMAIVKRIALAKNGLLKPKKTNSILKNPDGSITIVKKKKPAVPAASSTSTAAAIEVKPKLPERKPEVLRVESSDSGSSSSSSSSSDSSTDSSSSSSSDSSDEEDEKKHESNALNVSNKASLNQPAKKLKTKNLTEEHRKKLEEQKELRQKIESSSELIITPTSAAVPPGPKLLKKADASSPFSGSNHPTPAGMKVPTPKSTSPASLGSTPSMAMFKAEPKKRGPKPKNKTPPLMPLTDADTLARNFDIELISKYMRETQAQPMPMIKPKHKKPAMESFGPVKKPKQPKESNPMISTGPTQHLSLSKLKDKPKKMSMQDRLLGMGLVLSTPPGSTATGTYKPPTSTQSSPIEIKKVKPSAASPAQRNSPSHSPVPFSFKNQNQSSTGNKNASFGSFMDVREKSLLNTSAGGQGKSSQKSQQLPFPIPGLLQAGSTKNAHAQYIAAHSSILNLPNITIAPTTTAANVSGLPTYQLMGSGMAQLSASVPPKKMANFSMSNILGGNGSPSSALPKVEPGRNLTSMTYGGQGYQNQ